MTALHVPHSCRGRPVPCLAAAQPGPLDGLCHACRACRTSQAAWTPLLSGWPVRGRCAAAHHGLLPCPASLAQAYAQTGYHGTQSNELLNTGVCLHSSIWSLTAHRNCPQCQQACQCASNLACRGADGVRGDRPRRAAGWACAGRRRAGDGPCGVVPGDAGGVEAHIVEGGGRHALPRG